MFSKDVLDILNQICKSLKYKWASPHPPGRDKPLLSFLLPPKIFLLVQYWISDPTKIFLLPQKYFCLHNIKFLLKKRYSCSHKKILLPQNMMTCSHKNIDPKVQNTEFSSNKIFLKNMFAPTKCSIIKPAPTKIMNHKVGSHKNVPSLMKEEQLFFWIKISLKFTAESLVLWQQSSLRRILERFSK